MADKGFSGVFPYLVSPIDEHGRVKEAVLARLVSEKAILRKRREVGE